VLHHQGVERTTIADIADAADVPTGNVYYYFKTKDDLVQAALTEQLAHLFELTGRLDRVSDPRERLKALVASWVDQRDVAARYGCPTGTLAAEIGKRADGPLDAAVGQVIGQLLKWVEEQFRQLGQPDPGDLAITLVAAYQGMSLLASALRDPDIMAREGARLTCWLDSLHK
jgi:TetR/AcrR family transcriptional repressor of nem operon